MSPRVDIFLLIVYTVTACEKFFNLQCEQRNIRHDQDTVQSNHTVHTEVLIERDKNRENTHTKIRKQKLNAQTDM